MTRIKYQEAIRLEVKRGRPPACPAQSFGKTIFQYDRGSVGAEAYHQLADEIIKRGKRGKKWSEL